VAESDRIRWDRRYADPADRLKRGPHPLLERYAPRGEGLRALELACGLGYNALWLAGQGYTVDALDISYAALRHARAEMQRRGLRGVHFIVADLDEFPLIVNTIWCWSFVSSIVACSRPFASGCGPAA
jgi:SAM-dependent methyltransferase